MNGSHNLRTASRKQLAGGGQEDTPVEFGTEDRGFESSHLRSLSPPGSPLLAEASFLRNVVLRYFINKKSKR